MDKRKIDCKNDNKKQTTFIQSNNADPKNALLIRLLLRRIHLPRWGRLRGRASHFEEDPNAARCPTGSTPLRSAQDDGVY